MSHAVLEFLQQVMSSPWLYLALFGLALLDGFFPVVPAETSVITAGVFAATGQTNLALVIVVAALGAFAGDHISYLIGYKAGGRIRRRKAFVWARDTLAERGGLVLVVARYIPGGRTATTLTMGAVRHPLRSFTFFDAIAAVSWGVYSGLIGSCCSDSASRWASPRSSRWSGGSGSDAPPTLLPSASPWTRPFDPAQ